MMPVAGSNAKGAAGAGSALKVRGLLMVPVRVTFGGTVSFKLRLVLHSTDVSYSISILAGGGVGSALT